MQSCRALPQQLRELERDEESREMAYPYINQLNYDPINFKKNIELKEFSMNVNGIS